MAATKVRITGGAARGLPLSEPRGLRLRPTTALVREALFNIIGDRVEGARVLDLYAGTGAVGMEALSRGARHATFLDAAAASVEAIHQSLSRAGFAEQATVLRGRLPGALASIEGTFDIIFLDPPYNDPSTEETLAAVGRLAADKGLVVLEHGSRYNPPERPEGLTQVERRVYGDSALTLYARQELE